MSPVKALLCISFHLALRSNLEVRLFQPKLAENAVAPIPLGRDCFRGSSAGFSAFGLSLQKGGLLKTG